MSNDDHQLVPITNIELDCQYTKKMLHVHPMWPAWFCKISQTRPIKQRNVIHIHQSYYIGIHFLFDRECCP